MGTVGISFGSPTGGAGFDVAATVSQIVGNLKNVETPWKNQLTTLQSQDTALSSIGTLLSSLSTDIGALTDFTGVMAQKTGSSSDTNVLQLTSASSTATAGTHTITVTSLAKTSSGYLTAVTNSTDQLAGSISIQVGSGAAHKVNVNPANKTLAGLVAAINSAGIGVTASVLTDSSGSRISVVSGTSGANGNLTVSSSITDASNANVNLNYKPVVTGVDAKLNVDGVDLTSASNTVTNLIPGVTFQLLSPSPTLADTNQETLQVIIGNDNSGVETAINQLVTDYNALNAAINVQQGKDSAGNPEPLSGSPTLSLLRQQLFGGLNVQNPNGSLDAIPASSGTTLTGSLTLQIGSGTANTINVPDSDQSLQGLASAINTANIGVTATISTAGGQSTLSLLSQTTGAAGALTISPSLSAASYTPLAYQGSAGTVSTNASGTMTPIPSARDVLSGSISIQVGSGMPQTITLDQNSNTLQGLADAINNSNGLGVTASVTTNADGSAYLSLQSGTTGSAGNLVVTSNVADTTNLTTHALNYSSSSDLSTLAGLGITASPNADGTLSFNVATLDAALNSDFSGVLGFFQSANSWGQEFKTTLNNAGASSTNGILALAEKANSSMEKTLNDDISREDAAIATQQKLLTTQLNLANQILQAIPTQLEGVNMLYSAISGYNQKSS
jgi:flagellar hook-associated protein 2